MFGSTERVDRLRDRCLNTVPRLDAERAVIVTKAYQETEGEPAVIRRAKALKKILEEMTIFISDDELVVGDKAKTYKGTSLYPEYNTIEWFYEELDNGDFEKRDVSQERFLIHEEDKQALRSIREYWKDKNISHYLMKNLPYPEEAKRAILSGVLTLSWPDFTLWPVGHFLPNYQKLLEKGFLGIKKDAEEHLQRIGKKISGNDIEKYHFLKAVTIVCDATSNFGKRYSALARELVKDEQDAFRKAELLQIADNCDWVPANPARTFWEACQSFWFLELLLAFGIDLNHPGLSPGRFDQYMYPYYKGDMDEGRITRDQAQELIECVWLKMSAQTMVKREFSSQAAGGYSTGQNLILGGQTRDGRDATNELSFMCLDATAKLDYHEPALTVRIWNGTPDDFWNKVIEVTKLGYGMPAIFNDEIIIPQLIHRGMDLEDARNYAIVGCVEPDSPGNSYPRCGGPGSGTLLNLPQCLLLAVNNGVNPMTNEQVGPETGDLSSFTSFDEVKDAYVKQVEYFVDWYVTLTNMWDIVARQVMPMPLVSCVMEPCVERGIDVTAGGAKYNSYGITGVGTSNVADAFTVIKKIIFEDKKFSGAELLEAIRINWEGKEVLRNEIINGAPKYGNDDPYVDELARWATSVFCNRVNNSIGPSGPYTAGLWPVAANVVMGKVTGATLDGRKAEEPLAEGISPRQGMDKNGPTSVLKSASALDQFACHNGTLLNLKFHPNAVRGMEGTVKLRNMIQTYFDMKGMHVQYNVVSADTLRDAQKNPDQYKNLVVRVAGYSAFFVELWKDLQDDIIARTEHGI
jgi:pyruvate formate-lyase/glycerol dehydratase family glycyl radical enzyme